MSSPPKFWQWLFSLDKANGRGFRNIVNIFLPVHVIIGLIAAWFVPNSSFDLATKTAIPAASVLIGFSFAWAGRSASLFQDKTFSKFLIENGAPIQHYIYAFQLAILVCVLFVITSFILVAGGTGMSTGNALYDEAINKGILFFLASLSLRECWGVINFVNRLTLQFYVVREQELVEEAAKKLEAKSEYNQILEVCSETRAEVSLLSERIHSDRPATLRRPVENRLLSLQRAVRAFSKRKP